ncbi:MAG: hypothetical protein H6817_04920 [Phycisphaerales bacterium]|nr:hypothetical protein [Phycisphaerales bacterium]
MISIVSVTVPPVDPVADAFVQTDIDAPDQFNLVDVPCSQLLDDFTEETGWTFEGDRPGGLCSFDTGRERMGIELAQSRLAIALWESTGGVIFRKQVASHTLEIVRLADTCSLGWGLDWVFTSLAEFAESSRERGLWSLVLQDMRYGTCDRLEPHVNLLPTYVRFACYPGEEMHAATILAATIDLRKYCPLIYMLDIALRNNVAVIAEIELEFCEPNDLVDRLHRSIGEVVEYQPLEANVFKESADLPVRLRVWSDWAHRRVVVAGSDAYVKEAQRLAQSMDDWKRLCTDVANSPDQPDAVAPPP